MVIKDNSVAAVAAIPPASHIVELLHLKSKLPRRNGDVTLCTQCTLDRLERVEWQTKCWSGVICAAVMCSCPCTAGPLREAKRRVQTFHAHIEAQRGKCRLDIILVSHQRKNSKPNPCSDPWKYPINALRNVALRCAATELVVLLDVDFLPGSGIQEQLWKMDVYHGYLRACTDLRRVIVLPALEETSNSEKVQSGISSTNETQLQSALHFVSADKASVVKSLIEGKVKAFASDVYPPGHEPTKTERWATCMTTYEVQYKGDYEPYFLCARRLVPWYDERFTGYGRNKMIHAFHVSVLDFRFWVHSDWYVFHVNHVHSQAWEATLGRDPLASHRLADVKLLYESVKAELISFPSHTGICLYPRICNHEGHLSENKIKNSRSCPLRKYRTVKEQMGHWSCADWPSTLFLQTSTKEYLLALYSLRYHYCVPKLRPVPGNWPLRSKLQRMPRDISLVTVATPDRLHHLSAQCRLWKGVICAAIYISGNCDVEALKRSLLELHQEVERAGSCRLDLIILESAEVDKVSSCFAKSRLIQNTWSRGTGSIPSSDLCPINSLRNAALEIAETDLVLILDVDLLPSPSLNDIFLDERQYKCLSQMAMEHRIAFVVPSFEHKCLSPGMQRVSLTGSIEDQADDRNFQRTPVFPSGFEQRMELSTSENESTVEERNVIHHTEVLARQGFHAICDGLASGDVFGFHTKHFPAGHGPTDFEKWKNISEADNIGSRDCCEVCRSYTVKFEEGFEPFIVIARKSIPRFDERFRGYGNDKILFIYHLNLTGFKFQVLLKTFAVDITHAKSPDWLKTFGVDSDPLQQVRVTGLYHRAKRELNFAYRKPAMASGRSPTQMNNNTTKHALIPKPYKHFRCSDTSGDRCHRPTLQDLQLIWHGVIRCLKTSSIEYQMDYSIDHYEGMPSGTNKIVDNPEDGNISPRVLLRKEDDGTKNHSPEIGRVKRGICCFPNSSGWIHGLKFLRKDVSLRSRHLASNASVDTMEEFEWDSTGWELKCSPDSLQNCSVGFEVQNEAESSRVLSKNEGDFLRISMSAGSWSPQASRLAGITTGGLSVRSFLPTRSAKKVVVHYMVRFPTSFVWSKGGNLPGFWIGDLVKSNFRWRRAGEGYISSVSIGQLNTESEQQFVSIPKDAAQFSKSFYFVPGQWHALQLAFSLGSSACDHCQDSGNVDKTPKQQVSTCSHPLHFENAIAIEAFVDFEKVSRMTYLMSNLRRLGLTSDTEQHEEWMGLLLSAYFGGKTQDWAAIEDSHIDFSQFEIWTD